MRPFIRILAAVALLFPAGPALAASSHTSEAAFRAALGGSPAVHNYDALGHNATLTTQLTGVNYQGTGRAWDAASQGGGGTFHTPINVVLNFGSAPINFLLTPPVDGVGFYNTSIFDAERATFYDAANNVLHVQDLAAGSVNFAGYVGDVKIARVAVVGIPPTNGTIFIDTLVFGNLDPATPAVPATWGRVKGSYRF